MVKGYIMDEKGSGDFAVSDGVKKASQTDEFVKLIRGSVKNFI
jgi:hypothetical protein